MDIEQALGIINAAFYTTAGRHLTDVETAIFRGAWNNRTYEQIADEFGYSISYIQRDAGVKFWKLLSQALGESVSKTNFRSALERWKSQQELESTESQPLEVQSLEVQPLEAQPRPLAPVAQPIHCDWGEAIDVQFFHGRNEELNTLQQWILNDRCRLVAILGMGGVGKTSLSVKAAQDLIASSQFSSSTQTSTLKTQNFEYVIWRSLRNAPPVEMLLKDLISFLSHQQDTNVQLNRLMYWLRKSRCLIVLDNLETIMQTGDRAGQYRAGYENYAELLKAIGETLHQSCLIITSREKPTEVAAMEGSELVVRSLPLTGSLETAEALLHANRLVGSAEQRQQLCHRYGYNPLAIKIVSNSIRELFGGEIGEFLAENITVFNEVRRLLDQQFDRLTALEQAILYWLAINREQTSIADLAEDIFPPIPRSELIEALKSLSWRSMIEKNMVLVDGKRTSCYTEQPAVMEYVTERLIEQICTELTSEVFFNSKPKTQNLKLKPLLTTHALLKTTVKDYIRQTQTQLILQPIAEELYIRLGTKAAIEQKLHNILQYLRSELTTSYAAGNLVNLYQNLQIDLTGYDFSELSVWHAYLQSVQLHRVNFACADLSKSVFAQTFGYVLSVAISPDGEVLATGDGNGQVRFWRTSDGQPLSVLQEGYTSWIWSIAFSPDGQMLASGSVDQTVKLWNVNTQEYLKTLQGHQNWVRSVAFSPDGRLIATGSTDRTVRIWDHATGACLKTLLEGEDAVWSVSWHPNGRKIATGNQNHTLKIWNTKTEVCEHILVGHHHWVRSVAFSPDGKWLASGSDDRTVRLWDADTGECLQVLTGHTNAVWCVTWHPSSQLLASVSHDKTVRLWDVTTGECLKILQDHTNWVWSAAWSMDGNTLVSVAHDRTIRLWDAQTWTCLRTVRGFTSVAMCVAWSPDGQTLAGSCDDQVVRLWNRQTGRCYNTLQGHTNVVWGVAWSPNGNLLASSCDDHTVRLWDAETGQCLKILQHKHWVWSIAWHPNGQTLATSTQTYEVKLWDVATGKCIYTVQGHQDSIWSVAFSPDGQFLASGCDDRTVRIWKANTGAALQVLHHDHSVRRIAWSADNKILASSSADSIVRLWDVQTGECLKCLAGHTHALWSVAWSPEGALLASGGDDQTVRLWDTETGECLQILTGHTSQVWSIAFSPDGNTIASSSADQTIRLWDVHTGECIGVLRATMPYEEMNVAGITGITEAQKMTLKALGAIERLF